MREVLIVVCGLASAALALGECVEVEQSHPLKSSVHVRIVVLLNERPASLAKVDFCKTRGGSCLTAVSGDDGVAAPPKLTDGEYKVIAVLNDAVTGDPIVSYRYLQVSGGGKATTLPIDLTDSFRAAQNALTAADQLPIRERVQAFRGSLQDRSGAMVPGVNIKIVRRGSEDKRAVQRIKSDSEGQFSAQLSDGEYIAFFSFPGFRTEIVPFEIAAQGKKEMLVKLDVGRC